MKKILLSTFTLFLFCAIAIAQEPKTENVQKNFIVLTAGPSFPMGHFASTDLNSESGMAKTGFTIDLKYGHQINKVFGFGMQTVYGRYAVDRTYVNEVPGVDVKAWEYAGVLVGPMLSTSLAPKVNFDFTAYSGVAFANTPQISYGGQVYAENDWSTTVPVKVAADFRFHLGNTAFLFTGANYTYMRPKFNVKTMNINDGEDGGGSGSGTHIESFHQVISVFGLNAGVGIRF